MDTQLIPTFYLVPADTLLMSLCDNLVRTDTDNMDFC